MKANPLRAVFLRKGRAHTNVVIEGNTMRERGTVLPQSFATFLGFCGFPECRWNITQVPRPIVVKTAE